MCAAFTWFYVFCIILHTLIFAYSLHADAWVLLFIFLSISGSFVSLSLLMSLCRPFVYLCSFCVSLKCFCSCCGLCLFMVFAVSCGAFFSLWCRSQDETWGLPGFLACQLGFPPGTPASYHSCVCLVWMQSGWSISGHKTKRCVKSVLSDQ